MWRRFFVILLLVPFMAMAQDESDEFFEDDEGDMGFEEEMNPPEEMGQPPDGARPAPRNRFSPNIPALPEPNRAQPRYNGGGGTGEGAVEFRLVDPPKYWKPKKKKVRPPTSNNAAK